MIVKYTPKEGYMVPGWKAEEEREVSGDRGKELLATGQFTDVTPKPKKSSSKSTKSESKDTSKDKESDS